MSKRPLQRGLGIVGKDIASALDMFTRAAEETDDDDLEECFQTIIDAVLESIYAKDHPESDLMGFAELSAVFCERSEGELFPLSELVERAVGYVVDGSSRNMLPVMLKLTPYGLYPTFDPEDYLVIFENLGYLAATSVEMCQDDMSRELSQRVFILRDAFNERFRKIGEDGYMELVDKFECDENGEIPGNLRVYLLNGSRDSLDRFLEVFFD